MSKIKAYIGGRGGGKRRDLLMSVRKFQHENPHAVIAFVSAGGIRIEKGVTDCGPEILPKPIESKKP